MALRRALLLLPVLLALYSARAQVDTVYTGQTTVIAVQPNAGVMHYWDLYNDVAGLNLASVPGNCPPAEAYFVGGIDVGDSVEVAWVLPGTYFVKVTAYDTCTNNLRLAKFVVLESTSYASFLEPDPVCPGDTAMMTIEITGGLGPWNITFTDGTNSYTLTNITENPHTFPLIPTPPTTGSYTYWITSVTSGTGMVNNEPSEPVTLIVLPQPVTSPIYRYDPMSKK